MSLSSSLNIAQSSLQSVATQSSVLSRNIANVSNPGATRKIANIVTTSNGSSTVSSVSRSTNQALQTSVLQAQSDSAAQSALSSGLTQIQNSLGLNTTASTTSTAATTSDQSPSTMLGNLMSALQTYASQPDADANGIAAVNAAQSLVSSLNTGSAAVNTVREQADSQMATSVQTINSLLSQFKTVNDTIVAGTASKSDITDAQDTRDSILSQLSSQVGINTSVNANGGMTIYTDSGLSLFDQTAQKVSFTPTATYASGTTGNAVTVGGVPITGSNAVMAVQSGALAGLSQLRDTTAPSYQNQLDQIAGSLISTFAETGPNGTAPALAGLFTNAGSSAVPTSVTGLASSITVNSSVDITEGGSPSLLRDGNVSGGNTGSPGSYTYNTSGDAAYSGRLNQMISDLNVAQTFDVTSGGPTNVTLATYASSSVSSLESSYKQASTAATYQNSVVTTATAALSNATGVNLDDQMSQMLSIEQAYQASAQLLNTVNSMYSSLISALQ